MKKEVIKESLSKIKKDLTEFAKFLKETKGPLYLAIFAAVLTFSLIIIDAPRDFVPGTIFEIEEGMSVREVGVELKKQNVIRSRTLFNVLIQLSDKTTVGAGEYLFQEPPSIFSVTRRFKNSLFGIPLQTITISEGMTVAEIAERFGSRFDNFDEENFITLAKKYEGYLFPDTYKFSARVDEIEVLEFLRDTFDEKMEEIRDQLATSDRTLDEIIIMASIVEKEATRDTIQEVSDVLWERINIGMALQVDATFVYSIGKNSFTVTMDEIVDDDNLYNTYTHTGLPPTPISNPGLDSIIASIHSNPTDYLFFLTGRDGEMYFAKSFEGHKRNRAWYLD